MGTDGGGEVGNSERGEARCLLVVCSTDTPLLDVPEAAVAEGEDAAPWISWRAACRWLCAARAVLLRSLRKDDDVEGVGSRKALGVGRLETRGTSNAATQGLVNSMTGPVAGVGVD